MPLVTVKVLEGVFTPSQKQEMVRKLTDTMVTIEGENLRPATWVVIEEVKSGDWGMAGKPITTEMVQMLARGTGTTATTATGNATATANCNGDGNGAARMALR